MGPGKRERQGCKHGSEAESRGSFPLDGKPGKLRVDVPRDAEEALVKRDRSMSSNAT